MSIWNYKSAVLSSLSRGAVFFAANLNVSREAAVAAMVTEFCFRFTTAGFYGAATQAFRKVEPPALGMAAAVVVVPLVAHSVELLVHVWRGTPALAASIGASLVFTAVSTSFNLFAMRRGVLVVGDGAAPLLSDLGRIPRLLVAFLVAPAR